MEYVYIFLVVTAGSFLQTNTGLGMPILAMLVFPQFLSFRDSVLLVQIIATLGTGILSIKYIRYINWKTFLPFLTVSIIFNVYFIFKSFDMEVTLLSMIFSAVLVLISLFFFLLSDKISVKQNFLNAVLMGGAGGIGGGLFSVSGPPVAIYFLASTGKKENYIASIQLYFTVINLISIPIRINQGGMPENLFPFILCGWVGMLTGTFTGIKTLSLMPLHHLKKIVYVFIGLSGIWMILQNPVLK